MIVGKDMALINQTIIVFPGTLGIKSNHFAQLGIKLRIFCSIILAYWHGQESPILAWPGIQLWEKKKETVYHNVKKSLKNRAYIAKDPTACLAGGK